MTDPDQAGHGDTAAASAELRTLASRAREVAAEVADRLADPGQLAALTTASAARSGQPDPWQPVSLTAGYPGVAILQAEAGRPDRAHAHLAAAAAAVPAASTTSIYRGYGALVAGAAAVSDAAGGGYRGLLDRGQRWLAAQSVAAVRTQRALWDAGQDWADDRFWDTICGVTGPGRLLLAAVLRGQDEHLPALQEVLAFLVDLTADANPAGRTPAESARRHSSRPGWWIPPDPDGRHPPGGADLGVAHGISGPLALLAQAHAAGLEVPGQPDAVRGVSAWLLAWQDPDHRWPGIVDPQHDPAAGADPTRSAWCYGAAGVASSLLDAGLALGDAGLVGAATAAVAAMGSQHPDSWQLWGPTVCHGYAGLLAVASRVAAATGDHTVAGVAATAARLTLACFADNAPWGFRHVHLWGPAGPVASDVAGLLVGAAGVALALADWVATVDAPSATTASSPARPAPSWRTPLLLG